MSSFARHQPLTATQAENHVSAPLRAFTATQAEHRVSAPLRAFTATQVEHLAAVAMQGGQHSPLTGSREDAVWPPACLCVRALLVCPGGPWPPFRATPGSAKGR